jgi:hypothetical protein
MRARIPATLCVALAIGASGLAGEAMAQPASPGAQPLDNREPQPGQVHERERAAGIAPGQQQSRKQEQTVDQLYRELTGSDPNAPQKPQPARPARPAPAR